MKDKVVTFVDVTQGMHKPRGACINNNNSLYVCDDNDAIRKVDLTGNHFNSFTKFHFNCFDCYRRQSEVCAYVSRPFGISFFRKQECFYFTSFSNHTIHKLTRRGIFFPNNNCTFFNYSNDIGKVQLIAGMQGIIGNKDGIGEEATFNCPSGVAINELTGDIFIADYNNNVIRKIDPQGTS